MLCAIGKIRKYATFDITVARLKTKGNENRITVALLIVMAMPNAAWRCNLYLERLNPLGFWELVSIRESRSFHKNGLLVRRMFHSTSESWNSTI